MIIKTIKGRKTTQKKKLLQLFDYVSDKEKTKSLLDGNICLSKQYLSGYDHEAWVEQILDCDKNKTYNNHVRRVVLRHEICSFSKESTKYLLQNRAVLKTIQKEYIKQRSQAPGMAVVHYEKEKPIHIHYVFASTNIDGTSNRLNNQQLRAFKNHMENFEQDRFPELHKHSGIRHGKIKKKARTEAMLKFR